MTKPKMPPPGSDTTDFGAIPSMKIPPAAIPGADTIALARAGVDINRGNSNKQPLSPAGEAAAIDTGSKLADKAGGALAPIKPSGSVRAQQSAAAISDATGTPTAKPDMGLESWAQGNLEGMPKKNVRQTIAELVRKYPDYKIPGQGAMSTKPGESFNDFRMRVLPRIRAAMQELAHDPAKYIPIVLHSQTIKLIEAWMDAGMKDDYSINHAAMLSDKSEAPGAVEMLYPVKEAPGWRKEAIQLDSNSAMPPPPGILLIRHGMTESNAENYRQAGKHQDAMAQLSKHVKSSASTDERNFGRARAFAHQAAEGGVSDQDLDNTIDTALPSAEEAAAMPNSRLLAIATAASPNKKAEYAPLIKERFSDLSSLPPEGQAALSKHLKEHFGV